MNVLDAIKNRRSVRSYSNKPIPDDVINNMKSALRYAPSACNFQPWQFILVTDQKLKQQIAHAAKDQNWMIDAPIIIVACGFPDKAYPKMGGNNCSIDIDLAIAIDHLTLAAVAEGLGTCWIGAFSEEAIKPILNIPADVKVVSMTPLGYPTDPKLITPVEESRRQPESKIFTENTFTFTA